MLPLKTAALKPAALVPSPGLPKPFITTQTPDSYSGSQPRVSRTTVRAVRSLSGLLEGALLPAREGSFSARGVFTMAGQRLVYGPRPGGRVPPRQPAACAGLKCLPRA